MPHVKRRRPFVRAGFKWILRRRLQNRSRVCRNSAEDRAGVVNGFRKRIARLKAQPDARVILRHAGLQRVISGMRAVRHDVERAEAARDLPGRIKLCERRKARARPRISIREKDRGKMHAGRAYIRSDHFEIVANQPAYSPELWKCRRTQTEAAPRSCRVREEIPE